MGLVEAYKAIYPYAQYGAGHVVLADYSFDHHNIDFCLNKIKRLREKLPSDSTVDFHIKADIDTQACYDDPNDIYGKDHDATEHFLLCLKKMIIEDQ
ncbi:MAG: hypothetical protein F4090_06165 [Nitrospira sp. SB0672_bin_25]|nr:hypothetical protein [Nitrospira sp. SB0666_bin_27]MYJ54470.1 hypothetical protein [Nitrospira sp. SB0672_bin_25]